MVCVFCVRMLLCCVGSMFGRCVCGVCVCVFHFVLMLFCCVGSIFVVCVCGVCLLFCACVVVLCRLFLLLCLESCLFILY